MARLVHIDSSSNTVEVDATIIGGGGSPARGAPLYMRSDKGPEFVSRALLAWIVAQDIDTALIDPETTPGNLFPVCPV